MSDINMMKGFRPEMRGPWHRGIAAIRVFIAVVLVLLLIAGPAGGYAAGTGAIGEAPQPVEMTPALRGDGLALASDSPDDHKQPQAEAVVRQVPSPELILGIILLLFALLLVKDGAGRPRGSGHE